MEIFPKEVKRECSSDKFIKLEIAKTQEGDVIPAIIMLERASAYVMHPLSIAARSLRHHISAVRSRDESLVRDTGV